MASFDWTLYVEAEAGAAPPSLMDALNTMNADDGNESMTLRRTMGGSKLRRWRIRSSLPLAAEHNAKSLASALNRPSVDDLFLFVKPQPPADKSGDATNDNPAPAPPLTFLDPSCTPIELLLHDGSVIVATVDPFPHMPNAVPRALPTIASAGFRFAMHGDAIELAGRGCRKAVRIGADGWSGGVAIANAPLDSTTGHSSISFRVSLTPLRSSTNASNVDADGLRLPPEVGDVIPVVAVGLIDESLDATGDATAFGSHNKAWMMNTVSGALFTGSRQIFVDSHQFTSAPTLTLTLTMDTTKGTVFLRQGGRHIGGFTVSKYLSDSMYPCIEVYSRGGTVELL